MIFTVNSNLIITTSRKPSQITRRFAQFLKHYFNATYINRGKSSFNKVINQSKNEDKEKLMVITETKGNPSSINVYDILNPDMPLYSIYINVSLPQKKDTVNVDAEKIVLISKTKQLDELDSLFTSIKPTNKIRNNCIVIADDDKKDNIPKATFYDKNGVDTDYKVYIKGLKIN